MEKSTYTIPGVDPEQWYQKRLSAAQWQALLSHAFEIINPAMFMDDRGQVEASPNPLKILAMLTEARGKPVGEYFFGTILIPEGEFFAYDQILSRGRRIMEIDDPDVFLPLVKQVWADFLSGNSAWLASVQQSAGSLLGGRKQAPRATTSSRKTKGSSTG